MFGWEKAAVSLTFCSNRSSRPADWSRSPAGSSLTAARAAQQHVLGQVYLAHPPEPSSRRR